MKSVVIFLSVALTLSCTNRHKSRNFNFIVQFKQPAGLKAGDQVRCLGVAVGKVESVTIEQSNVSAPPLADVAVSLEKATIRVRRGDSFRVATAGLLGEAYLEIDPGKGSSPPITEGATVLGENSPSLRDLHSNFKPLVEISTRLESLPPSERERMAAKFIELLDKASKKPPATNKRGRR